MTRIFLSTAVLLALAGGTARAEDKDFEDVPVGSWPYSALAQLVERGEIEGMKPPFVAKPMVRYEFAVQMARWMEHQQRKGSLDDIDKSSKDIGCALGYEFAPEIVKFRLSSSMEENPLRALVGSTPPSEWFEIWWGNSFQERRTPIPRRAFFPAPFLRRRANGFHLRSVAHFVPKPLKAGPVFLRPEAQTPTGVNPQGTRSLQVLVPDGTLLLYDKVKLHYTATDQPARAASREFEDVPLGSWPYSALNQLLPAEEQEVASPIRAKTRYEFAVAILRLQDKQASQQHWEKGSKAESILVDLSYEFAPEIAKVAVRLQTDEGRLPQRS